MRSLPNPSDNSSSGLAGPVNACSIRSNTSSSPTCNTSFRETVVGDDWYTYWTVCCGQRAASTSGRPNSSNGVRHLSVRHRTQPSQELGVLQPEQVGVRPQLAKPIPGTGDLHRVQVGDGHVL